MCDSLCVEVKKRKKIEKKSRFLKESCAYFLVYSECTRNGLGETLCIKYYFHTQQGLRQAFLIIVTLRKKGYLSPLERKDIISLGPGYFLPSHYIRLIKLQV